MGPKVGVGVGATHGRGTGGAAVAPVNLMVPASWVMSGGSGSVTNSPAGTLNLVSGGVQANADQQVSGLDPLATYRLSFDVTAAAGVRVGATQGATGTVTATTGTPSYTVDFVPGATSRWFRIFKGTGTSVITNVTLYKL